MNILNCEVIQNTCTSQIQNIKTRLYKVYIQRAAYLLKGLLKTQNHKNIQM